MTLDGPQLLAGLADGSLPAAQFSHTSHVHAAWQCLRDAPLPRAAHRFADVLQAYVKRLGAEDKYHHTLTLAFMHVIHQRMKDTPGDWAAFVAANGELLADAKALIERHYSPERLAAPAARRGFVEPDRLPLPGNDP
ncbi:MAG: hypothetical protein WC809_02530 [Sinimarinibacterium sp.]|jgi:hypothetical protein